MTGNIWKEFNQELLGFIKVRINNAENAEDILQEVFIKIHKNAHHLSDNKKISSWIYQITRNTIIDFYRKKKSLAVNNKNWTSLPDEMDDSTADFTKCIKPFIHKLPEKYQDVLLKTTFENISQKEYAATNNLSYTATKSRVQRARKQLNSLFVNCCAIEADKYGNIISSDRNNCDC